jgi:drug/metabolite transporter (DMT)-like permease
MSFLMLCAEGFSFGCARGSLNICFSTYTAFGALIYTVVVGNGFAYTMYATVLKKYSVTFVSLASISIPLFVALFGYVLFGETVGWNFFVALILFVIGIALFNVKKVKPV